MKNVFYNLILFILCYALNYLIYEKYGRRDLVMKDSKIISAFFVTILFFISAFLFFLSIYLNNEMFN